MDLKILSLTTDNPKEFFNYAKRELKLSNEQAFKLYFLTLRISVLSDTPVIKFLERVPPHIKFDEIERHKYLLSLPVSTIRNLFIEHFDLKFSKNLYLYLQERLPSEFFKGCEVKRSFLASQDLSLSFLTEEERRKLPSFLKVKHQHFSFLFRGSCEEAITVLERIPLYIWRKIKGEYLIFFTLSVGEFIVFSKSFENWPEFREKAEEIIMNLKSLVPECFG